jgi:hypothetical protein
MRSLGVRSASSRRTVVAMLVAGFACTAVSVQAQDAPAPAAAPAAQEAAPPDPFKFTTDAAVMTFYVKADQTSTFENIWSLMRGAAVGSTNPAHKAVGDSVKLYRAAGDPTENGVAYFVVADPVDKALSYSPVFFLFETGAFEDATARKHLADLQAALNGVVPVGVTYAAAPVAPPPLAAPAAPAPAAPAAPPAQ